MNLDRSINLLHSSNDDFLIGFEKDEVRLIHFNKGLSFPDVQALDIPRVSAITLLNNRYLLLGQKGGQIIKVDVNMATEKTISNQSEAIMRTCKIFCKLLHSCDCLKLCQCKDHDDESIPDDSKPKSPNTIIDDEPCENRHSARLQWTPRRLAIVGNYVVAFSIGNRRMAVMDQKLNLLFERYLGKANVIVHVGQTKTQKIVIYQPKHERLEAWSLSDYVTTLPGLLPSDFSFIPPAPPSTVTYYGSRYHRASPNPQLNVCVFTVIEPGQSFTDPNQNKLLAQIKANVFDIVNDYYYENSYDELDVQFSVFGADFGGTRIPLVLPKPVANYFWDEFEPGGVRAIMPADWTHPVVLDGTETLQLHTNPRVGIGKDYQIPFAALWTSKTHNSYPVEINFNGTENLQLTVEDQEGNSYVLDLNFDVLSLTHNQGNDDAAFLNALGNHFTNAIRNAEASNGDPITIQNVIFRRIRFNDDDSQFGDLQGQFKIAPTSPANFIQKGTITITSIPNPVPVVLDKLGFATSGRKFGILNNNINTRNYLRECLSAAQADMGEGPGLSDPHFNTMVTSTEDIGAKELTVTIELTSNKGGTGANIEMTSSSGHDTSGWSGATPIPGSESSYNNRNTLRYAKELIDDVFTAALDHIRSQGPWNANSVQLMFNKFDVMMIGFVGQPPTSVPIADRWNATNPADFGRLRMFARTHYATDLNNPDASKPPVSMNTSVVIGQKFNEFFPGLMSHELGHAISLPDLYYASGYRDDVLYIDEWEMMGGIMDDFNHFCGWSKWALGWIVEDSNDDLNRVLDVPLPKPTGTTITEAWLVPVEYWDGTIKIDVRTVVGGSIPIVQLMKVHLGSDGGVINFLELRSPGSTYSHHLPPTPSVIATNVLDPNSDRYWAVNGLYRRSVHCLNQGNELMNIGDSWDFASGKEFPLKGCKVEVVDIKYIRGGSIPIFLLRVERESADFIDIHFQDPHPSWRSPDIWVDWPADNPNPDIPRVYPEGTPMDQGETIRFPSTGEEKHYLVTRPHNAGTVRAEDVKIRWFVCDPPGAGDEGKWIEMDTKTIPEVGPDNAEISVFDWNVNSSTNAHQCLRAEIIDWTIPAEVDPATGDTVHLATDDVKLQNNIAQKNVFNFEALKSSPYDTIEFHFQVQNDRMETEIAALVPEGLPWGSRIDISPSEAPIKPGKNHIFTCKLSLDDSIIEPGCNNDSGFLLTAWRRADDADERWGSCFYFIRPRYKTEVEILEGYWIIERLNVYGRLILVNMDHMAISSYLPLYIRLRLEINKGPNNSRIEWRTLPVDNNGQFKLDIHGGIASESGISFIAQAWFDRTDRLGSSVSKSKEFKRQEIK